MASLQDKILRCFQSMDKAYEEYAKSKGMTYLCLVILEEIYELGDGCTQKQISEDIHYPKQSVNLVVKSFMENGIVKLKELPENRKNKGISLTDKGHRMCDEVVKPLLQQEKVALTKMKSDERCELIRLLDMYGSAYCECVGQLGKSQEIK